MEHKTYALAKRGWALGIILVGWVLCAYLVFHSTQLANKVNSATDLCETIFGSTCDKALKSSVAVQLGFPLAALGLAYFGLLALLVSLGKPITDRLTIFVAAFGVGVSAILSVIIVRAGVSCPLCMIVHMINLSAFVILVWNTRQRIFSTGKAPAPRIFVRWAVLLLFMVVLGGASEYGVLKTSLGKKPEVNLHEIIKKFRGETVYQIPAGDSPRIGSPDAPVQIVVFSSFQCPGCKAFAPSLENIHRKFGDKVGIAFKNFPLSTNCNPRIIENMQPRACDAAIAAIAAQRQNLFWKYHDRIFQSDLEDDEKTLTSIAENIGLDMAQWEVDRQSEAVKESLSEDVQLAYQLSINATPTVFINGRRTGALEESVLISLIENELNSTSNQSMRQLGK
jgi:protein-disulfide isomerase/uncharacterized membrane protein